MNPFVGSEFVPKVLQVSPASCPAVFQHEDLKEAAAEFHSQKKQWALLQETLLVMTSQIQDEP